MKKQVKIIMLPTDEESILYTSKVKTDKGYSYILKYDENFKNNGLCSSYQHLYLVSDEEIKEGDWTIKLSLIKHGHGGLTTIDNEIELREYASQDDVLKVIATTDKTLSTCSKCVVKADNTKAECVSKPEDCCGKIANSRYQLPQIPQSFIQEFVKAEGKIDEVMVEYEEEASYAYSGDARYNIKLTDNNEVIIHLPEDLVSYFAGEKIIHNPKEKVYSREEVEYFIRKSVNELGGIYDTDATEKWIEENL